MTDRKRNSLLTIATILLLFTSFGKGVHGQCSATLENIVVYEGTPDIMLLCESGPNGTAWAVRPTSKASTSYPLTNFDDTVSSNFTSLYANNQSGLIIRNATTTPTGGPITTAGIYIVRFPNGTQVAAKVLVIRSGPICTCDESASGNVTISCTMVYADHPVGKINEILICSANGVSHNGTLNKTLNNDNPTLYVYTSVSTITFNTAAPSAYDCQLTFSAPSPPVSYLAKNAPDFRLNFTVCERSTTALSTTTAQPTTTTNVRPTTTTKPITTTAVQPTTTAKPTTATTLQPTTTAIPTTTTAVQPTTTGRPPTTTAVQPTTTAQPTTATILQPTTTAIPTTTTAVQLTTTGTPPTTTVVQPTTTEKPTTATTLQPTTTAIPTTTAVQTTTTGFNEIDLLTTKIILGVILGFLLAAVTAIACSWCFNACCPPLLPLRRPIQYIDGENLMGQRREWIPVRREICQTDYLAIPFYQQSFCRYPAPYEYRLPTRCRCRCLQSSVGQPSPRECRCARQQGRITSYCDA